MLKSLKFVRLCALVCGVSALFSVRASADLIDLDMTGVPVQYRAAFVQAERFWEARLIGFSDVIPRQILGRLHNVEITVTIANIDGPGGVLGFAGPNEVFRYRTPYQNINVSQTASMTFDENDVDGLLAAGLLDEVVLHEMAHALGFGSLWTANEFNAIAFGNYNGTFALRQYRLDSRQPLAQFVPVEQQGGGGTAGAHWDSNDAFFFNPNTFIGELMIGFITDAPYVSDVTWASYADLGYTVNGINDKIVAPAPVVPGGKVVPNPNSTTDDTGEFGSPSTSGRPTKTLGG